MAYNKRTDKADSCRHAMFNVGEVDRARKQSQRSSRTVRAQLAPRAEFEHPPDCGCETCALRDPVHPQTLGMQTPLGCDVGRVSVAAREFIDYKIGEDWSDD